MARRSDFEREEDLVLIAKYKNRNFTLREIADKVTNERPYSISYVTVKNDLDEILIRWQKQNEEYISSFVAQKIEEIRNMKNELWNEYFRSKKKIKSKKEKRKATVTADTEIDGKKLTDLSESSAVEIEQTFSVTEKVGDPRFLQIISNLISQEAKLLGFDKGDVLTVTNNTIIVKTPTPVSKEQFIPGADNRPNVKND